MENEVTPVRSRWQPDLSPKLEAWIEDAIADRDFQGASSLYIQLVHNRALGLLERQGIVVDVEGDEVDFYDRLLWELRQAVASRANYVERPLVTALAAISALSKISKSIRPGYAIPDGEPKGVLFYQTFSLGEIGARLALEEIGLPDVLEGQINATPIEEKKPSRRGGHNKKWYPLAEPYLTEHPEMSRYAIAKMVLAEGHEGDESAILRAIRNELGKQGQG